MSFVDPNGLANRQGAPFALSVLGGALFTTLGAIVVAIADLGEVPDLAGLFFFGAITFAISIFFIALAAGLIGLPLTWLLARYRLEARYTYPLAGLLTGGAIVTLLPLLTEDTPGVSIVEFYPFAWVGALPGCVCGTIWWLAYRRHVQEPGEERG